MENVPDLNPQNELGSGMEISPGMEMRFENEGMWSDHIESKTNPGLSAIIEMRMDTNGEYELRVYFGQGNENLSLGKMPEEQARAMFEVAIASAKDKIEDPGAQFIARAKAKMIVEEVGKKMAN